jgi:hypothetical protein
LTPPPFQGKQLWCVEPLGRLVKVAVGWAAEVRVRHVGSGKYLAVNTDAEPARKTADGDAQFAPYLCDDAFPDG